MKLHQLSIFLENRPGTLKRPCRALADAGINMLALTLADSQEFGILRILAKDWQRALDVLQAQGFLVKVTEVVAIDVPQRPGGLYAVLDILDAANQSIEYMYAFAGTAKGQNAALVFRFEDPDAALPVLAQHGLNPVAPAEIFERMNA